MALMRRMKTERMTKLIEATMLVWHQVGTTIAIPKTINSHWWSVRGYGVTWTDYVNYGGLW